MVYKVKANWEACLASRKSKLSVFTTCLYGKRTHQRACLEKSLIEVSLFLTWILPKINIFNTNIFQQCVRVQLLKFDRLFYSAFGAKQTDKLIVALREHYHTCVHDRVEKIVAEYDYFHYYWEPKIIIKHCCTHRCNVKFTVPCMRLCLDRVWRLCLPSLHSCVFHC